MKFQDVVQSVRENLPAFVEGVERGAARVERGISVCQSVVRLARRGAAALRDATPQETPPPVRVTRVTPPR